MTNKSNPVGYLQEFCQRYKVAKFPDYISLPADGPDHSREFYCKCIYDGFEVIGRGNQKKQAKTDAARKMLSTLEERNYFDKLGLNVTDGSMTLNGIVPASPCNTTSKNPISALQEHCQRNSLMLPTYFDTTSMNSFICECSLNSFKTFGKASNKKMAKTESAMKMCEKLGIISNIDVLENDAKEDNMMYCHDKNAVSALQELCAQNKSWGNPVYENGEFNGQFVVVCHLGSLSAEGRDTTKKGAKLFAANNVLSKLIKQGHGSGYKIEPVQPKSKANGSMGAASLNHQQLVRNNHEELQDFNLDEEEDTEDHIKEDEIDGIKNKNEDAVPLENLVLNTIESLSLEDSVVEVEPLTTSEQQKLDGNTSNTEIYNSESDNCKRKIEEDISSESHQQVACTPSPVGNITLIYADMKDVIPEFWNRKDTAFAHCISADLSNEKNMSAGVAVVFKKYFGKPQASDLLSKYLTYQYKGKGAGVYSLVTKVRYSDKPRIEDYKNAFQQLKEHFKKMEYKQLICSPMGCVRDQIPIEHFAVQIVTLQRETGATVNIITCEEPSSRGLYKNLPYSEFVKELQQQIDLYDSLDQ
uniref:DRBM domain-containing protein n=1 Tax=Graphocephala atropunctata TaxID=36148 RepID=A0A1B6LAY9_9HEMI